MRHTLEFTELVFQEGINVTVMKGPKWFEILRIGDTLNLIRPGQRVTNAVMVGKVTAMAHIRYADFPAEWLKFEHDPTCHTLEGLTSAMARTYGSIENEDMVTVVFFVLREKE